MIDEEAARRIKDHCQGLISIFGQRDSMIEDMRRMFHMEWGEVPTGDWIKETMSPTAYNSAIGAIRLLTSSEPQFRVPFDEDELGAKERGDKLERMAVAMHNGTSRISQRPFVYEVVLSGILFGEICARVVQSKELVRIAEESGNKGNIARFREMARQTPYYYRAFNPATCYPDFDGYGLHGMLYRTETSWGEIVDSWGGVMEREGITLYERRRTDRVVLNDWYDWEYRCVWLDSMGHDLWCEPHGMEFLPVVDQITEGSMIWREPERQRFPFLYSLWKSNLWRRENLTLTTIYTQLNKIANGPTKTFTGPEPNRPLRIDRTTPDGIVGLHPDEKLEQMQEQTIDPGILEGLRLIQGISEQSTIPRTTLGAQPEGIQAFSAISMLASSGRLPLMGAKTLGGQALAKVTMIALKWWKADGIKGRYYGGQGRYIELSPEDIPDDVVVECNLEPDLPQDKLQMANTAIALTGGDPPLTSNEWVHENILNIGQSGEMMKRIWAERATWLEYKLREAAAQQELAMKQQMAAAQMQQALAPASPTPLSPVPLGTGGNGSVGPYPPGREIKPGAPLQGPLPPREEQGI
jgi:hypothetical protein